MFIDIAPVHLFACVRPINEPGYSVSLSETGERQPGGKGWGGISMKSGKRERGKWDFLVGGNRDLRVRQAAS